MQFASMSIAKPWVVSIDTGAGVDLEVPQCFGNAQRVEVVRYYLDAAKVSDSSLKAGATYAVDIETDHFWGPAIECGISSNGTTKDFRGFPVVDEDGAPGKHELTTPITILQRPPSTKDTLWKKMKISLTDRLGMLETAGTAITKASKGANCPVLTVTFMVWQDDPRFSAPQGPLAWQANATPAIRVAKI